MESVYLKQLVNTNPEGSLTDLNSPFSFLEWKQRRVGISETDVYYHYNTYVLEWFDKNKGKPISQKFILRQKYLYMLDQLELFFSEEEKNNWYAQVNLADEKELLLAIPYFARKLKDIALYYLNLRKQLKNTKLKYNTVGTNNAIERELYSYLLDTFSSNNNELSPTLQSVVPSFSALQNSLVVEVEELYDDQQYFDISPTKPLSGYFDLFHEATGSFLATKGITLSSSEWLFETLNVSITSIDSIDTFLNDLTGNVFETTDSTIYGSFVQKYLAENKYYLGFTSISSTIDIIDVNITQGNNYFYYPYGTTDQSVNLLNQIPVLALSSLNFNFGTGGTTLKDSDTIFVKNGNQTKSAWLHYKEFEESEKNVKAILNQNNSTSFIFPYPGYGVTGPELPWTGPSLDTSSEYNFLTKQYKALTNESYWAQTLPVDSCEPILLNNSTLISSGAISDANPGFADQFFIRQSRSENTTTPYGELNGAWLYKVNKTSLPISPNQDNVILWPYTTISVSDEYPEHLKKISFSKACNPVSIADLSRSYFIAASSIELADKMYKVNNFADPTEDAIECAWLSGSTISLSGYKFIKQDGFASLFAAGEAIRFVWTGPESTLDSVFQSVQHRKDCPFVTNSPIVSAFDWQKCACKQVYHSPFGHSSKLFQEENSYADCVVEDTENKLTSLDFSSWKDSTGNPAFSSLQFAWYRTTSNHSWGNGKWVSNLSPSNAPFTLKPGRAYFYKRANAKTTDLDMPPYVVNYSFRTADTKWVGAKKNNDGTWISADEDSSFVLYSGDFVNYERQLNTTSYLLSTVQGENTSSSNSSIWSTQDSLALRCGEEITTTLSWPTKTKPFGSTDNQYPTTSFADIAAINAWKITRITGPGSPESQMLLNQFVATFVPPVTGTYTVAVTATKIDGTQIRIGGTNSTESTVIPSISSIPQYYDYDLDLKFETPTSGLVIEHPLQGWNYNTNKADSKANGAQPYWAELYSQKDSSTRFKGIYSWGYLDEYIDGYLPNNTPVFSPIEIAYGTIVEYFHKGYAFTWNQPIIFKEFIGETKWYQISSSTTQASNLSSFYDIKINSDPIVIATSAPSDILLSNTLNGSPVEVFYYALNSFTWPVSVELAVDPIPPISGVYLERLEPWNNLTNRFFSTVANIPVTEQTYSLADVGGYFLPQHLGASQFINKDFTSTLKTTALTGTLVAEDTNIHIGGRGRTKEDQSSLYDWKENNQWLKEPPTAGDLAGAIKKNLTKTLQTFVPYQSNIEETSLGLVTTRSRLSPWGGVNDEEWTDVANEPTGFTGVRSVSSWAATQILKQNEKELDCWTSDIYGNQYGLFKELSDISVAGRREVTGELWAKLNDQTTNPAYISLSAIFNPFKTANLTVYDQLTSDGIKYVDCYFDTIFIETNNATIFSKVEYDYENALIDSTFDDTRYKLLTDNFRFEKNWFFSSEKKVISLYTEFEEDKFYPSLYELDISSKKFKKIFPTNLTNTTNLTSGLNDINIKTIARGAIHFNKTLNTYLITYTGTDTSDKMFLVDFYIKSEENLNLTKINLYKDFYNSSAINEPPIVLTPYLSAIQVGLNTFNVDVDALNSPTSYSLLNYATKVTVSKQGTFTGKLSAGLHHINYKVSNKIGSSTYCLTLSAS